MNESTDIDQQTMKQQLEVTQLKKESEYFLAQWQIFYFSTKSYTQGKKTLMWKKREQYDLDVQWDLQLDGKWVVKISKNCGSLV